MYPSILISRRPTLSFGSLDADVICRVTDFEEQNHMTAEGLAIVFSPNLLRAPQNDFAMILANMGHTQKLVKSLITHVSPNLFVLG